jgi:hypothetical protein
VCPDVVGVAVALAGVLGLVAISAFWCQSRIFKQRQLQLQRAAAARLCSEERHDAGAEADTEPEGRTGRSRSELRRGVGVGIGVGDDNRVPLLSARERRAAVRFACVPNFVLPCVRCACVCVHASHCGVCRRRFDSTLLVS